LPSDIDGQLSNVAEIFSNAFAFAARIKDGSVVAWGDPNEGGLVPEAKKTRLTTIRPGGVHATSFAFAAHRADGTVVCWGNPTRGGDCETALAAPPSPPTARIVDGQYVVEEVYSTDHAFSFVLHGWSAASRLPGSTEEEEEGGASNEVEENTVGAGNDFPIVPARFRSRVPAATLANDPAVLPGIVCSGAAMYGGNPETCGGRIGPMAPESILANNSGGPGTAAADEDDGRPSWLEQEYEPERVLVRFVEANPFAFVAVFTDGTAACWGREGRGGTSDEACGGSKEAVEAFSDAAQVFGNEWGAFAVLSRRGRVYCFGSESNGGSCGPDHPLAKGLHRGAPVETIFTSSAAMVALKKDGSFVCWGRPSHGGDCRHLARGNLKRFNAITGNDFAFVAWDDHNSPMPWLTYKGDVFSSAGENTIGLLASLLAVSVAIATLD
jgi:hypothetical protein